MCRRGGWTGQGHLYPPHVNQESREPLRSPVPVVTSSFSWTFFFLRDEGKNFVSRNVCDTLYIFGNEEKFGNVNVGGEVSTGKLLVNVEEK